MTYKERLMAIINIHSAHRTGHIATCLCVFKINKASHNYKYIYTIIKDFFEAIRTLNLERPILRWRHSLAYPTLARLREYAEKIVSRHRMRERASNPLGGVTVLGFHRQRYLV